MVAKKKDNEKNDEAGEAANATAAAEPQPGAEAGSAAPADAAAADSKPNGKGKKKELDASAIHVKVYSPYQIYYDGQALSISAENDTGPFDILPKHHNFMTLVNSGEIVIRVEGEDDKKIRITRGVMHVRSNKVTLFLDV